MAGRPPPLPGTPVLMPIISRRADRSHQAFKMHFLARMPAEGGLVSESAIRFAVKPNATSINPEGDFRIVVYRAPDHSGDVQLPTLLVDYPSYQPIGVDLEKRGKKSALKRRVLLEDTLMLRPMVAVDDQHRDP